MSPVVYMNLDLHRRGNSGKHNLNLAKLTNTNTPQPLGAFASPRSVILVYAFAPRTCTPADRDHILLTRNP